MSSKTNPTISVGMPVYNGEPYLESAIRSVLDQSFGDFELLISDNASTDATADICHAFEAADSRVKYERNPRNLGAAGNYARVFARSSGRYFRWMNADDLIEPTLHEVLLTTLENNPDAVLAYGKTILIDGEGDVIGPYEDNLHLTQKSAFDRLTAFLARVGMTNAIYGLMRRKAVAATALFGDGKTPASDTLFMAELVLHGQFVEVPTPLFYRRIHEQASSADREDESRQAAFWGATGSNFVLGNWRRHLRFLGNVKRSPVPADERRRLYALALKRMIQARAKLTRDLLGFVASRRAHSGS